MRSSVQSKFVICVKNDDCRASLELRKIYQTLSDSQAAKHGYIRVVDESGEDYLYPADYFVPIQLPASAKKVFPKQHKHLAVARD